MTRSGVKVAVEYSLTSGLHVDVGFVKIRSQHKKQHSQVTLVIKCLNNYNKDIGLAFLWLWDAEE